MPLSEALGLSNTTKLFNHFILFSTLSHRFCYWPFMLQGEWHQPWPEHFRAVLYNNSSFFIFVLICSLKDKWKSYCKVKWVQMTPTLSISSKKWRNVFGHSVATDPSCVLSKNGFIKNQQSTPQNYTLLPQSYTAAITVYYAFFTGTSSLHGSLPTNLVHDTLSFIERSIQHIEIDITQPVIQ